MSSNNDSTAVFSVAQVMTRIGIGRDKVYGLIREGHLPAKKIGRRTIIVASDLEAFLRELPRVGDPEAA
jgi:excisionase family DNA binding protein